MVLELEGCDRAHRNNMLDKLHLGLSANPIGHEFNIKRINIPRNLKSLWKNGNETSVYFGAKEKL